MASNNPANYQTLENATEGIRQTYNASAGTDIVATIDGILIGNLNGISFSTTREKAPIYVMGSVDAVSFGRGKRGHAGSLIFTNFDRHALYDIMQGTFQEVNQGPSDRYKYYAKSTDVPAAGRSLLLGNSHLDSLGALGSAKAVANYSDQIPPFTITLTSMNEYGNISAMHILGVELINEGSGVSIDDIVTETQMTFVARAILGWKPISQFGGRVDVKADVLTQMNSLTAIKQAELAQSLPFRA
jgi:hypothetical protein